MSNFVPQALKAASAVLTSLLTEDMIMQSYSSTSPHSTIERLRSKELIDQLQQGFRDSMPKAGSERYKKKLPKSLISALQLISIS